MKKVTILILLLLAGVHNSKAQSVKETIDWLSEKINSYAKLIDCYRNANTSNINVTSYALITATLSTVSPGSAYSRTTTYSYSLSLYDVIGYEFANYDCDHYALILKTYGNKIFVTEKIERSYYDNDGELQTEKESNDHKTASLSISTRDFNEPDLKQRFARALSKLIAYNKQNIPAEPY